MALMAKGKKRSATKEECDKIQQAVWNNDVSTIQQLLDNNIDVINADVFSDKWTWHETPLHHASRLDKTDIVKILLQEGADVNAFDECQRTPLHTAVFQGNIDIVKILLTKGANLNAKDVDNISPLQYAEIEDQRTIIQCLENYRDATIRKKQVKIDNYSASHNDQSGSHDDQSEDDSGSHGSSSDIEQQVTFEDVNKGYMDGELLGPDVRLALLGAEGSGKTSLSHTLVGKDFEDTAPTEGVEQMKIIVESTSNWIPLTHAEKLEDLEKQKYAESILSAVKLLKSQPTLSVDMATSTVSSPMSSTITDFDPSNPSIVSQHVLTSPEKLSSDSNLELSSNPFVSVHNIENLKAFKQSYDPKKKYVNIWDFAGQQVFQHTHGIFVSEETVCLVVFDAGLALEEVPERRYPNDRTPCRTVLETICYWMELIGSRMSRPSTSDDDLSILLPTFILVGTQIDKVCVDICIVQGKCFEKFLPIFKKQLVGKPFSDHIAGSKNNQLFEEGSPSLFFISNLQMSRDPVVVNKLKQTVMQAASITRKTRPTRYVEVERKLMLLSSQDQMGIVRLDEVAKIAKSCGLPINNKEILEMTQYLHHKGALLHFYNVPSLSSTVILSPSWLAKLLTYVLTNFTCLPTKPELAVYAEKRQNKGLLEEQLIHWSVEQFNKSQSDYNRITASLRGTPIIELFTKFQIIVDVTKSTFAGNVPREDGERLFLVPHLMPVEEYLPSKDFSFKILYNFPAHFIPDNLIDQLIVKCAQWNNDHQYDLIRLSYQWVQFELGKYQTYELRPNYKLDSIELAIIPDPSMPSQYEEESYKDSNELIDTVKEFINDLMKEHMTATFKKFPVESFIPCPDCDHLHIKLKGFADKGSAYCTTIRSYCRSPMLSRYHKMLSIGDPMQSPKKTSTYYAQSTQAIHDPSADITHDSQFCKKPINLRILSQIKRYLASHWKDIAYELIDEDKVENIASNNETLEEKCFNMLKTWRQSDKNPCYCKVFHALETYDYLDSIRKVKNILNRS